MVQESWLRRLWRLIYPWLTYYGVCLVVEYIGAFIVTLRTMSSYGLALTEADLNTMLIEIVDQAASIALEMQVAAAAVTLPLLILYYWLDRKRDRRFGLERRFTSVPSYMYLIVVILGITACLVGNNFILISGYGSLASVEEIEETMYTGRLVLEFVGLGLLMPAVEEFIFRGLMYRRLRGYMRVVGAAIVSALIFAIYHGNLIQGIYAFFMGLLFVYVYERFHNMAAPIIMHMASNVLSIAVSETNFLNSMYESGRSFWTGTIIACLLLIIMVYCVENFVHSEDITDSGKDMNNGPYNDMDNGPRNDMNDDLHDDSKL